jgi:hypothetical protein
MSVGQDDFEAFDPNKALTNGANGMPYVPSSGGVENGAWVPRRNSTQGTLPTTGALGEWASAMNDPNSGAYNLEAPKSDLEGAINRPEQQGWLFELVAAGRGHNSTGNGVFQALVAESAARGKQGERITPQQLAYEEALKKGWIKDGKVTLTSSSGSNGSSGSGSGSSFRSTVNLTDPGTAKILVDQALTQYLGRKASEQEINEFRKALTAQEMSNPNTVQAGTTTTKKGKKTTSSASLVQGGGFNPQAFAEQYALGQEGAAEYQAATTFLDTFMNSLGNPNEVV